MNTNVFNQYYFAFLKKLRDKARESKETDKVSRNIIRAIKNHYLNYSIDSDEYINYYIEQFNNVASAETPVLLDITQADILSEFNRYIETDEIQNILIYKDISFKNIQHVLKGKILSSGYFLILLIFGRNGEKTLSDEDVNNIVELFKNKSSSSSSSSTSGNDTYEESVENIKTGGDDVKTLLRLFKLTQTDSNDNITGDFQETFKDLEETSLGKLAKEIMQDVDLNEIQKSMEGNNDIFQALANPEGGLTKLLGTVSQKMISKIASGELKQDMLLQDAIKFSSKLQQSGASGPLGNLGDLGSMMGKVKEMASAFGADDGDDDGDGTGAGAGFDMSMLKTMMQSMAGNMAANKRAAGGGGGARGHAQPIVNSSAMDRIVKAKQLRKKLEEKRKKSSTKVEEIK